MKRQIFDDAPKQTFYMIWELVLGYKYWSKTLSANHYDMITHLIFVANANNGVSVKILKWEAFLDTQVSLAPTHVSK